MVTPSVRWFFQNWRESEDDFADKLQQAVRNNVKKIRTGRDCCGHHGEPGC